MAGVTEFHGWQGDDEADLTEAWLRAVQLDDARDGRDRRTSNEQGDDMDVRVESTASRRGAAAP